MPSPKGSKELGVVWRAFGGLGVCATRVLGACYAGRVRRPSLSCGGWLWFVWRRCVGCGTIRVYFAL